MLLQAIDHFLDRVFSLRKFDGPYYVVQDGVGDIQSEQTLLLAERVRDTYNQQEMAAGRLATFRVEYRK